MLFSVDHIIQAGGLLAIALVIFAEGAFLVGFFLPGDTLLIPAGIWASHHHNQLDVWILLPVVILAAIAGYQVGYVVGERAGPKVFTRNSGVLFRADYIPKTKLFLSKHGGKSLILGRFVAVVRTLIPVMSGVGKMPKRNFFTYNVVGAVIWASTLILTSYWIGRRVSNVDKYILPIVIIGLAATVIAEISVVLRSPESRRQLIGGLREEFDYFIRRKR